MTAVYNTLVWAGAWHVGAVVAAVALAAVLVWLSKHRFRRGEPRG